MELLKNIKYKEVAMSLAVLDYIIIGLIVLSALIGLWRGFFRELFSLITLVVALFFSLSYANNFTSFLERFTQNEKMQYITVVVGLFLIIWIIGAFIGMLLAKALRSVGLGLIDRLFGTIFGAGRGVVFVVILLLFVKSAALHDASWSKDSVLSPYFQPLVSYFEVMVPLKYAALMDWIKNAVVV